MALLAASCGDDDAASTTTGGSTAATTTTVVTTTAAPATTAATTTTTAATTTTTAPTTATTFAGPYYLVQFSGGHPTLPDALGGDNSIDPRGSGCSPPGDVLPDGIWLGFAEEVVDGVITFDLACYFGGDAAVAAAAADGLGDPEEGYYVRNMNPKVFAVPISPLATAYTIYAPELPYPDLFARPIDLADWPHPDSLSTCPGDRCAVWLYVNGGVATAIVEAYA